MNVHGFEVPKETLSMLAARMQKAPFGLCEITACALGLGVPHQGGIAARCADRLIQWHRKRGDIRLDGRIWTWIGERP